MTNDPSIMQIGTRNSLLHEFATSRSFAPLSGPIFLTLEEVVERYRRQVSAPKTAQCFMVTHRSSGDRDHPFQVIHH